jgi:hypothetical protein
MDILLVQFSCLIFLLALAVVGFRPDLPGKLEPSHVVGGFSVLFLFEFFVLGPSSFVKMDDEGDYIVPFLEYVTGARELGKFSPDFMGGIDLYSATATGMQYVNWDNIWFSLFPVWVAILLHKASVLTVGLTGVYLLLRKLCKLPPVLSILFACLYCVTPQRDGVTLNVGVGFFLLPLSIYILVGRLEGRRYFLPVLGFCLLSATTPITHVLPSIIDATIAAWVVLGCRRPLRLVAGLMIVVSASLINWHEVIWAGVLTSGDSYRASADAYEVLQDNLPKALESLRWYHYALWIVPIAILAWFRDRRAYRLGAGAITILTLYFAPFLMPWEDLGLATLRYISYDSFKPAIQAVSLIGIGWAAVHLEANWPRHMRVVGRLTPVNLVFCAVVAFMVYQKSLYLRQFLAIGGQAQYHAIDNLGNPDWLGSEPVRTVAVGFRYPARNIIEGAYGLEGFGGKFNIYPRSVSEFWNFGVARPDDHKLDLFPAIPFQYEYLDRDTNRVDIERLADLNLLAAANVGFIASEYPLESDALTLVSGPPEDAPAYSGRPSTLSDLAGRLDKLLARAISGGPIYIYAVPGVLPRAYGARGVETYRAGEMSVRDRLANVSRHAADRVILVEQGSAARIGRPDGVVRVDGLTYGIDRITIDVSAPSSGIVVLNAPYSRFWKVLADGSETPVVPANHVQMAIPVPAGANRIEMLYCRPMLREIAARWLAGEQATGCPVD